VKISLDANAYSALGLGQRALEQCVAEADRVCVSTVVLGEIYAGFRMGTRYERNLAALMNFLGGPGVEVTPVTHGIAERYGVIVKHLKEQGTPIPTNDIWIAATALETGTRLVSYDSHFGNVPGLIVLAP
jgi:tRNA(fMet)-specific endonuclease VapC